jgi:hypothetical protein
VPIPSLTSAEAMAAARRLLDHGRQVYAAARRVETRELVAALGVVRDRDGSR